MTMTEKTGDASNGFPVTVAVKVDADDEVVVNPVPATDGVGSGLQGAMYFKNPSTAMLQQAEYTQKTSAGLLFISTKPNYSGKFTVPKRISASHLLSGEYIDLSYADFVYPVTKIIASTILGEVKVTVPPGVRVHAKGVGILGDFKYKNRGQTVGLEDDAPLIVLSGFALLAEVKVKVNWDVPPVHVVH